MLRDGPPEQNCRPGNGEQCQGMAEAPSQPVLDDVPNMSGLAAMLDTAAI